VAGSPQSSTETGRCRVLIHQSSICIPTAVASKIDAPSSLMYGPSDAAQATCCFVKQCSASSYGTSDIRLRATKSLTASMGRQSRQLTECQAGCAYYVELHCLEGALEKEKEKFCCRDLSNILEFWSLPQLGC
jgi:hypothetical protein